jgi:DNA-binding SARP family transcriptional activator
MTPKLEFCLLGPVVVRRDGMDLPVPRGRQRAMLAALLLNAGRAVSVDDLAEALWGPTPPPSARATVRNYVKRLRQVLGDTGLSRIVTRPPGYLIRTDPGELDVTRFEALLAAARDAARGGSWQAAAGQARAALALWRGEPLADVTSEALAVREVPRLAELRLQAAEVRIDAELHLGRQAAVIAELDRLAAAHPLREHLHALLMLALYREGRQAEALAAYRHARQVLVGELGAEPGAELRALHRRILATDPALARAGLGQQPPPAAGPASTVPCQVAPRQLPGLVRHFAGREAELAELTGMLDPGSGQPRTLVISAIAGMAGLGKTALAVQWAHQVADRFPDGQLYVNLRGFDPGPPVPASDALAWFLRALGVARQDVPAGPEERAVLYRSLLAGRRALVLLDNAAHADQVRPLLPGSPSCTVVVTSRDALAGLVARDGARRLDLGLLPQAAAAGLLRALIGERAHADPAATAALARQCARLPLALRVAAERAVAAPDVPLAALTRELAGRRRLDVFDAAGDPRTAVRAVFSWSVRHLDDDAARAFRLLGLHPGADLDAHATAALTGSSLGQARRSLDRLARACLVQRTGAGRYAMHDLLRCYAAEQAVACHGERERREALTRLLDGYLAAATAAAGALFPADTDRPPVPVPAGPVRPVTSPAAARAWLDAQWANLVAVTGHAAAHGWPAHAIGLAATVFRYPEFGHFCDAATVHRHARSAAARTGDHAAEAAALTMLGMADAGQGRVRQAAGHLEEAVLLYRGAGDQAGEAGALAGLGFVGYCQGRYQESAGYCRKALALYRRAGAGAGEARVWHHLGLIDLRQGRPERAAGRFRRSLAIFRQAGLRSGEARVLRNLGELELRQGRYERAATHLRWSLVLCRETGSRALKAEALACLGLVTLRQGRPRQATGYLRQSLALHSQDGDHSGQAEACNGLGDVLLLGGRAAPARSRYADALAQAIRAGDKYQQARAHRGLASACHAAGEAARARGHRQRALALYTELGTPEAGQVRAEIAQG